MHIINDKLTVLDSIKLSEYILSRLEKCSHLKLQKFLYYVNGFHLGYFGRPIIEDNFQAWAHGPVSRKVFDEFKHKSSLHFDIETDSSLDKDTLRSEISFDLQSDQLGLMDEVLNAYEGFSGIELESMTHSEYPWIETRKGYSPGDKCSEVIPVELMISFLNDN